MMCQLIHMFTENSCSKLIFSFLRNHVSLQFYVANFRLQPIHVISAILREITPKLTSFSHQITKMGKNVIYEFYFFVNMVTFEITFWHDSRKCNSGFVNKLTLLSQIKFFSQELLCKVIFKHILVWKQFWENRC